MKQVTCIEDLPTEEMREQARSHLAVWGNIFVHNTEEGPILLNPQHMTVLIHRAEDTVHGAPLSPSHVREVLDSDAVQRYLAGKCHQAVWDRDLLPTSDALQAATFRNEVLGYVVDAKGDVVPPTVSFRPDEELVISNGEPMSGKSGRKASSEFIKKHREGP